MRYLWLVLLLVVLVAGCQVIPDARPEVPYGNGRMQIQHSWPHADLQLLQHAVFDTESERREFLISTYFQQQQLLVIALTLTGHELFRVTLTTDSIQVSGQERLPDPRLPLRLVAEMQLTLLPADSLNKRLTKLNIEDSDDKGWKRVVYQDSQVPVLTIEANVAPLEADVVHITHAHYTIQIATLERTMMETEHD